LPGRLRDPSIYILKLFLAEARTSALKGLFLIAQFSFQRASGGDPPPQSQSLPGDKKPERRLSKLRRPRFTRNCDVEFTAPPPLVKVVFPPVDPTSTD
jgi:hypothetical protein